MKNIIRSIVFFLLVMAGHTTNAQLSAGGIPRRIIQPKMAVQSVESLPVVNNDFMRWLHIPVMTDSARLKPLTFAHPFMVNYSSATHGKWYRSEDNWWVWQMTVRSEGAFSLNLLFGKFKLPAGASLFIFTPGQQNILGAFTDINNSEDGIFLTSPLPGDQITVQYEIPEAPGEPDFIITQVNHDFLGILKYSDNRRPMGTTAGTCNYDVNCNVTEKWKDVQNSVCRIMVQGTELCTGTLLNNTSNNKRPLILTANHCINTSLKAGGSLFLFNYESPYCGPLDGDVTNSLSGSKLKATLDSLDFALVELNVAPPPSYRPYYAGWSHEIQPTDTIASIHHPMGDIKKIAIDYDSPVTTTFQNTFVRNAFRKILRWDIGTTEIGSSGAPLFNKTGLLMGSLSGGAASCGNSVNDYFVRFDMAWNYKSDTTKQLKYWLDPAKSNPVSLNGLQPNSGEDLCGSFTNLSDGDTHQLFRMRKSTGENAGYWTGTNSEGITEIADKFYIKGNEKLYGVSLGIGKISQPGQSLNSYISIKFYNLTGSTATLIASKDTVSLRKLVPDAMNYIRLNKVIEPKDSFLVAVSFENVRSGDTIAVYHSLRPGNHVNTFLFNKNGGWYDFKKYNNNAYAASLALELIACNIGEEGTIPDPDGHPGTLSAFPSPVVTSFQLQSNQSFTTDKITIYNSLGQGVRFNASQIGSRLVKLDLQGNTPGVYFIRVKNGTSILQTRILYFPN